MDVEMGLPSPRTPSMKRVFQMASPRIIEVPRTPRSEGFLRRKQNSTSLGSVDLSPASMSMLNSDTPPMSGSSSVPLLTEEIRDPTSSGKDSQITISESRFYSRSSSNKKCLLPILKTVVDPPRGIRSNKNAKRDSLKRKRSKSLDHRKVEPVKLNKNVCHKIKRPKIVKLQKPQKLSAAETSEPLDTVVLPSTSNSREEMELVKQVNLNPKDEVRSKLTEKKISVNVNRMVRVNVQGGVLRFTKHIRSPRKNPKSRNAEIMDLVDDTAELCEDWINHKVDSIIGTLDKENNLSEVSSSLNESDSISSLIDSTAHLSDAFCELEVGDLRSGVPTVVSGILNERINVETLYEKQTENSQLKADVMASLSQEGDHTLDDSTDKLFPVFYKTHQVKTSDSPKAGSSSSSYPKCSLPSKSTDGFEQLIIDAGQKSLGPSNCPECGFYYQTGDPDEERMHSKYHDSTKPVIKHTGWKWERVAASFPDGRVVHVCPSDPKPWWAKVESILEKANDDLGISLGSQPSKNAHAYFYVGNMLILGCLIAEPIRVAYRMLESDRKELERLKEPGEENSMETPSFCSNTPVRGSRCGINRIWVCASERRKGIATKMLDAVRATFVYGHILKLNEIAFSDPTPLGMALAVKYIRSPNFLVYKLTQD